MKSTAFKSRIYVSLIFSLLLPPMLAIAGGGGSVRPFVTFATKIRGAAGEGAPSGYCFASDTRGAFLPSRDSAISVASPHFEPREIMLSLSSKNSLVRVSWSPLKLTTGGRLVAYSLLGYEYLRQEVQQGVTIAVIDTSQMVSGIYVLRLETLDGQPLGSVRLVVSHPMRVQPRG